MSKYPVADTTEHELRAAAREIPLSLTRSQIPALSDAICRGIEHIERELAEMPYRNDLTEERNGLGDDFRAMVALRDDIQRQIDKYRDTLMPTDAASAMARMIDCDRLRETDQ